MIENTEDNIKCEVMRTLQQKFRDIFENRTKNLKFTEWKTAQ